jgi:hypothetical protein
MAAAGADFSGTMVVDSGPSPAFVEAQIRQKISLPRKSLF